MDPFSPEADIAAKVVAELIAALPDPVTFADFPSGRIREVNQAFCRLVGRPRSEVIGRTGLEIGFWGRGEQRKFFYDQLTATGAVDEMEVAHSLGTGERAFSRMSARRLDLAGRPYLLARLRDITDQRAAEAALLESQDKFAKAFRANPHTVAIATVAEGRLLDVNDGFVRDFGWSREEAVGRTVSELALWGNPADRARIIALLEQGRSVRDERIVFRTKQGALRQGLYYGELTDIAGKRCLITLVQDITERQRMEEQLRNAQRMESVGLLAGGVAHDFNNILTIVMGNTALALQDRRVPAQAASMLRHVQGAAELGATLTRQLLVFSRRHQLQPGRVALGQVAAAMASLLQRTIGEAIAIKVAAAPHGPDAHADAGMVEQVLLNLAVNARDAMPGGGEITISTASVSTDAAYLERVPQAKLGDFVGLRVRDQGTGIPPEVLPRIFEPFFTTKPEGSGTGLGLAMVYGIAQQHGGWIEVASEVGRGSEFTVWFPALPAAAPEASAGAGPAAQPARGQGTILLVEDKEPVRTMIKGMLERHGYRVLPAGGGSAALDLWHRHRGEIDLLFTDVVMQGMNGRQLAERLRSERPDLRVVYCSGYDGDILGAEALNVPGTRFLAKPFEIPQAMQAIREVLSRE